MFKAVEALLNIFKQKEQTFQSKRRQHQTTAQCTKQDLNNMAYLENKMQSILTPEEWERAFG